MEWLGTGFVLTIGGVRLRVRLALEDVPCECAAHGKASPSAREEREHDQRARRTYRVHPR
jgi:hypothetical protein